MDEERKREFRQIGIELTDVRMRTSATDLRENLARVLHEVMCMDDHWDPDVEPYEPIPGAYSRYQRHADTIIDYCLELAAEVGIT